MLFLRRILGTGNESIVYFTRDLSPEGLRKAYGAVCGDIVGRVAVKLHTGEQNGPNIIPSSWVKELGMGNDRYIIIDLDNGGRRITVGDAVKDLKPFVAEQK